MVVYPFYGQTSRLTGGQMENGKLVDSAPSSNKVFLRLFPKG